MKPQSLKLLILSLLLAPSGLVGAATLVFENQFSGTWSGINNGTPFGSVATYTPSSVGSTFTNDGDTNGATWTVDIVTPQPWSLGGVIFTGGGNTTGQISTSFNTTVGATYTASWAVSLLGSATTTDLIASAGGQTQVLGTGQTNSFTFTGTGSVMTLSVGVNSVGANSGSDVQLDFMKLEFDPVPESSSALLCGLGLLGLLRRRR
ncbi:MAG: hypothetical protein ABIT37_21555 [Luteolibacter sp.]